MKRHREPPRSLVRQTGSTWEIWNLPESGVIPSSSSSTLPVPPAANSEHDILAVPARLVVSAALWVPTVEAAELDDAVRLELELSGLPAPKSGTSSICLRTIAEENGRSLVTASVFPTDLPASLSGLNYRHFEATPHLLELPPNAATFWREEEDLVLCITRGSDVAIWETMHADASDTEISLWIQLMTTQLQAEAVIPRWLEWHDPNGVLTGRNILLPSGSTWIKSDVMLLRPRWPSKLAVWQPPSALQVIDKTLRAKKIRQLVYASAAAYLTLLIIALGYIGIMKFQAMQAGNERDRLAAEVDTFAPVSRAWQLVSSTVETEQYPLEILHYLVANMPESGIRLTSLSMTDNEVLVEGEAASVTLASRFFASIEDDKDFVHVKWEMPPPSLLPNSTARFQMRGTIRSL